jgi:exodeoxyribonuclease VII small subunit
MRRTWNGGAQIAMRPPTAHEKTDGKAYTSRMSKQAAPPAEPMPSEPAPSRRKAADAASAATSAQTSSPVADFETSLDALEALVERMEQGQLSLEDSLAAYERGVGLYRHCQQALEQAELRVRLLSDPDRPETAQRFGDDD